MPQNAIKKFKPFLKVGLVLLLLGLGLTLVARYTSNRSDVLGLQSDVTVTAEIGMTPIIWVSPQNRIPPVNNDSLEIQIEVREVGTTNVEHSEVLTVNNQGYEAMQQLSLSNVNVGQHDVAVKGLSHLRRVFANETFGPTTEFNLDLRYLDLLAGDSHPTSDNYINSLDISYEILNIYNSNLRADLNRDGKVNSLEFPTLISNLYKHGDI